MSCRASVPTHPVQQPTNDLLVALVRSVLQRRHAVFVQYVSAQIVFGVDFLQPIEVVDENRLEHVLRHLVDLFPVDHFRGGDKICGAKYTKSQFNVHETQRGC